MTTLKSENTGNPRGMGWGFLKTFILVFTPLLLLGGVIALFLVTNGAGLNVEPAVPVETVQFGRTILKPGSIEIELQNTSPHAITIAALNINDNMAPFTVKPAPVIGRLGSAVITITYPWVHGGAYTITLFSSNALAFTTTIAAAVETRGVELDTLLGFTLIGLYVGVIPVFLGLLWYPALRSLGRRAFIFLMAVTTGLLLFLGIDAVSEALEQAGGVGSPFQGKGLVGIGITGTVLLLYALSRQQQLTGRNAVQQRFTTALMISTGIGLHNLGEGLAIGASYAVGAANLGTFFVIGFIIQNITEGLGILAPIVKDKPGFTKLLRLGLIAGVPAIAGAWIGGLSFSVPLSVLFLSIGAGAVFEVAWEIGRLIREDSAKHPLILCTGVITGMLLLYLAGFLVK